MMDRQIIFEFVPIEKPIIFCLDNNEEYMQLSNVQADFLAVERQMIAELLGPDECGKAGRYYTARNLRLNADGPFDRACLALIDALAMGTSIFGVMMSLQRNLGRNDI